MIASTASPYKFSSSVLAAIAPDAVVSDEFEGVELLHQISKLPIPQSLACLKGKEIRFKESVALREMPKVVKEMLSI